MKIKKTLKNILDLNAAAAVVGILGFKILAFQ